MEKKEKFWYWFGATFTSIAVACVASLIVNDDIKAHGGVPIPGNELSIFLMPAAAVFSLVMIAAVIVYYILKEDTKTKQKKAVKPCKPQA